jgi:hypothetical protein
MSYNFLLFERDLPSGFVEPHVEDITKMIEEMKYKYDVLKRKRVLSEIIKEYHVPDNFQFLKDLWELDIKAPKKLEVFFSRLKEVFHMQ